MSSPSSLSMRSKPVPLHNQGVFLMMSLSCARGRLVVCLRPLYALINRVCSARLTLWFHFFFLVFMNSAMFVALHQHETTVSTPPSIWICSVLIQLLNIFLCIPSAVIAYFESNIFLSVMTIPRYLHNHFTFSFMADILFLLQLIL